MSHSLNSHPLRNKSSNNQPNINNIPQAQSSNNQSLIGGSNTQNLFKVLKKSQIDTTTGGGFALANALTGTQLRTNSRNNNNMQAMTANPQISSQNNTMFPSSYEFNSGIMENSGGSPSVKSNTRGDLISQENTNGSVNRQSSNRRITQQLQGQQNSQSLQVQNINQLLKDQANAANPIQQKQESGVFPPMSSGNNGQSQIKQNGISRNQIYKQSLSDSVNQKLVKGLSPKASLEQQQQLQGNQNFSPNKNHRAISQITSQKSGSGGNGESQFTEIPILQQSSSGSGNLRSAKGSLSRTRNNNQNLNKADLLGNQRPQFYTMKNNGGNSANQTSNLGITQQSPHNFSGRFNNSSTLKGLQQQQQQNVNQQNNMGQEYDPTTQFMQSYDAAKFATKRNGVVVSYAANTHQGIIRNYNEDRVSIILNIIQPKFKETKTWPRCSFFGVYDGHGGAACADYLRDQLHQLIVKDPYFPQNPKKAIENAFIEAERAFMEFADQQAVLETGQIDRSGSCAIIALIVGDICYVANVGDSRAVMSVDGGEKILLLSKDHKPESDDETKRIEENGGRIYQNSNYIPDISPQGKGQMQLIVGPHRVFPGRLSVSRTIGDIEAKEPKYGGNPNVVIPTPDIKCFKIRNNYDFIIIACDGVFEKLNNLDCVQAVWQASKINPKSQSNQHDDRSIHEKCGHSIDRILQTSAFRRTFDNITAVMIAFENFENIAGQSIASEGQADSQPQIYHIDNEKQHMPFNRLETVVEEEYIQSEEVDQMLTEPVLTHEKSKGSTKNQNDSDSKQNYQQSNDSKEDYQFDINSNSNQDGLSKPGISSLRKKSAENIQSRGNGVANGNNGNRRQSASSPSHSRDSNAQQQSISNLNLNNNNNGQNNTNTSKSAVRMSFQVQSQNSQLPQPRLSNSTLVNDQNQQLKDRVQDQLFGMARGSNANATGNAQLGSSNGLRNNKSSSLGRRDQTQNARIVSNSSEQQVNSNNNSQKIQRSGVSDKGYSSTSRNDNRNISLNPQQLPLTQSLVSGVQPLIANFHLDNSQQRQNIIHQNTLSNKASRNQHLKQYQSLNSALNNQINPNLTSQVLPIGGNSNEFEFNRTQQVTSSHVGTKANNVISNNNTQSSVGGQNTSGKNWFSNTQQLTGISQLHKHYEKKQTKTKDKNVL